MNELRKGFYVLDMAVFGFFLFALNHTMYVENWIVRVALGLALLLRIIVPLLLYKKERFAIIPLVAFVLLYGVAIYADAFYDFITNMTRFPELLLGSNASNETMVMERPVEMSQDVTGTGH